MSVLMSQNVGLIYGTDTGNTEEIGEKIAEAFANEGVVVNLCNITDISKSDIESYDFLIMGIPTWDFGGIQEDWENVEQDIRSCNLNNKVVALYGLGDQRGYGDFFLDAMGWLHECIQDTGADIIGRWPTEGYDFAASLATNEDNSYFCGLAIDEDQQFELTDQRVQQWVAQLISTFEVVYDDVV